MRTSTTTALVGLAALAIAPTLAAPLISRSSALEARPNAVAARSFFDHLFGKGGSTSDTGGGKKDSVTVNGGGGLPPTGGSGGLPSTGNRPRGEFVTEPKSGALPHNSVISRSSAVEARTNAVAARSFLDGLFNKGGTAPGNGGGGGKSPTPLVGSQSGSEHITGGGGVGPPAGGKRPREEPVAEPNSGAFAHNSKITARHSSASTTRNGRRKQASDEPTRMARRRRSMLNELD